MTYAKRMGPRIAAAALAAGALAVAGTTLATSWTALASSSNARTMTDSRTMSGTQVYQFSTLDNSHDLTFNQLLGINNHGEIGGYLGSGLAQNPNSGYLLSPPYGQRNYLNENFPHSVQTQVTGLNDNGDTVGFWSHSNNANQVNDNLGFYKLHGQGFHTVQFPTGDNAKPPVNQLTGVNNHDVAAGFYTNGGGLNRGYTYNIKTKTFTRVLVPGYPTGVAGPSVTAAAINNHGDVAGFYVNRHHVTDGFLSISHGTFLTLDYPGATATQALGVNDHDEVVGDYTDGTGSSATTHGFTWTFDGGFGTVDDPFGGVGATTVNGVNNEGDLVGFFVDGNGFTHGILAVPAHKTTLHVSLSPMPAGYATIGQNKDGSNFIQLNMTGLTPASVHWVDLFSNGQGTPYGQVTADNAGQLQDFVNVPSVPAGSQVWLLGDGTNTNPIAKSTLLTSGVGGPYPMMPFENGFPLGSLHGHATIVYNPAARTISVTLTASGLSPGPHAAHIHVGYCTVQGPVQYMFKDFTADSHGNVDDQTRVATGVTIGLPSSGWYLNVHQGDSSNIVSNGQPTELFRPLLCANI